MKDTYLVHIVTSAEPKDQRGLFPGYPWRDNCGCPDKTPVTLSGGCAELMRQFKETPRAGGIFNGGWNAAGVLADRLEEHPDEASDQVMLPRLIAFLRHAFTNQCSTPVTAGS